MIRFFVAEKVGMSRASSWDYLLLYRVLKLVRVENPIEVADRRASSGANRAAVVVRAKPGGVRRWRASSMANFGTVRPMATSFMPIRQGPWTPRRTSAPGDALVFRGDQPHSYRNLDARRPAVAISIPCFAPAR